MSGAVPVLLYHVVADAAPPVMAPWTVAPSTFRLHLDLLARSGRRAVTLTALADRLRGGEPLDELCAITFDDGWACLEAAVDELAARGLTASAFVSTGHIGTAGYVTADALARIAGAGVVELGSHGITHRRLDELDEPARWTEIAGSKRELEALLDQPVRAFAYPHGAHDRRTRAMVVAAAYDAAAAVKDALSGPGDNPYAVARLTVTARTPPEQLAAWLAGTGARRMPEAERLRTRGYRVYRRVRRRLGVPV